MDAVLSSHTDDATDRTKSQKVMATAVEPPLQKKYRSSCRIDPFIGSKSCEAMSSEVSLDRIERSLLTVTFRSFVLLYLGDGTVKCLAVVNAGSHAAAPVGEKVQARERVAFDFYDWSSAKSTRSLEHSSPPMTSLICTLVYLCI
jgi:hypothetical protein